MKEIPPPYPPAVEQLAKDVGSLVLTLDPCPSLQCQMVVFGALFLTACEMLEADPDAMLNYIGEVFSGTAQTKEEFQKMLHAEGN